MATKIRLKRFGGKHDPHFRIVVADSRKQRDGRAVEELGYYSPAGNPPALEVNVERAAYWLEIGAQPTDTVRSLLAKAGVLEGPAGESVEQAADVAEAPSEVEVDEEAAVSEAEEAAADVEETSEEAPETGDTQ